MSAAALRRFIDHYERLTRWQIEHPRADLVIAIGKDRTPMSWCCLRSLSKLRSLSMGLGHEEIATWPEQMSAVLKKRLFSTTYGGEGGIRTHVTVARKPHFECGAFDHSATSPCRWRRAEDASRTAPVPG